MSKLRCVQVIDFYSGLVSKKKYRIEDCKWAAKRCYNIKPCQLATIYRIKMILVALKHDFGYKVSNLVDKLCSKIIICKVQILWEGHKKLKNKHTFLLLGNVEIRGEIFFKACGLLTISKFYLKFVYSEKATKFCKIFI